MSDLSILCVFYDGYEEVWQDFFNLFYKYWSDCPYKLFVANNCSRPEYIIKNSIEVINAGEKAEFSTKVRKALDLIDTKYVLLLLEDFFFSVNLNSTNPLDSVLEFMEKNNSVYYAMPLKWFASLYKGKKIYKNVKRTVICFMN